MAFAISRSVRASALGLAAALRIGGVRKRGAGEAAIIIGAEWSNRWFFDAEARMARVAFIDSA